MYYLPIIGAYLNSYKGLTGVLGTVIIYAILLLLILVLRPLSRGFKVSAGVETIIWFGLLMAFTLYKLITF